MNLRALSTSICAAAGLIASTAIGEPAWAETGTGTSADTAQDIAYTLGYATPAICCLAVIAVVVVILVRRSKRR